MKGDRTQFQERRPVIVKATGEDLATILTCPGRGKSALLESAPAMPTRAALSLIKAIYERDRAGQDVLCPVLAYYGAGRAWLPSNARVRTAKTNGPARRWAAFYDCFSERIRFAELKRWFSRETTERGNRSGSWRPGFEVVRRAILRCVPDAEEIWFDPDLDQVVLCLGGNAQPFDNLSGGQRMMAALVADLAIKAVTQNAFLLPRTDWVQKMSPCRGHCSKRLGSYSLMNSTFICIPSGSAGWQGT